MSDEQTAKATVFRALHKKGAPLILFNIWDPGSAAAVAKAGAKALATGSWSVANALGYADGETVPFDLVLQNLGRIARGTSLPVTLDMERGYGHTPAEVGDSVKRAVEMGAVGLNIEDSLAGKKLRDAREQTERLRAACVAANHGGVGAFVNARIDVFLQSPAQSHASVLPEALARAEAYRDAGVDGIFLPGLVDLNLIGEACETIDLPVNIMAKATTPPARQLAGAGVARISHGPGPYSLAMAALAAAAADAFTP